MYYDFLFRISNLLYSSSCPYIDNRVIIYTESVMWPTSLYVSGSNDYVFIFNILFDENFGLFSRCLTRTDGEQVLRNTPTRMYHLTWNRVSKPTVDIPAENVCR